MHISDTERRLLALVTALAGLAHLFVPGVLLATAKHGYRLVLDVEFRPRDGAKRRVRLLGVVLIGAATALWRRDE